MTDIEPPPGRNAVTFPSHGKSLTAVLESP